MVLGGIGIMRDDAKVLLITNLLRKLLGYGVYNRNKYVLSIFFSFCDNYQ